MSSLINKAKEAVENVLDKNKSSGQHQGDNPTSGNYGPHGTSTGNQIDPRVDSDRDHRNDPTSRVGGHGNTQETGQYGTTGGYGTTHSGGDGGVSVTDRMHNPSTHHSTSYDNVQSGNAGPHSSNLLNRADPRVDSDRDHRNDPTSRVGGIGQTQTHGDSYGHTGGLGTTDTSYGQTSTTGVHGSAPVHDATTTHHGHHSHGTHTGHTGGLAAATTTGTSGIGGGNTYDNPRSTNEGPHSSNLLNKVDPRTDSDRDHRNDPTSRVGGYGTQGDNYGHTTGTHGGLTSGTTGGYDSSGTGAGYTGGHTGTHTGTHTGSHTGTHTAGHTGTHTGGHTGGYADDTTGTTGGYGRGADLPGSGNAPNTAGPHSSDFANKVDPRVDSDLDGSKTYGGNQTYR